METSNRFECLKHASIGPNIQMEMAEVIRNSIWKGEFISIQSPTFWYSNGSTRIHPHSQRGKAYVVKQRHSNTSVSRRLVTLSPISADLLGAVKTTGRVCSGTRLGNQLQKIRLPRVQIRLKQGRSLTHRKEMAHFDNSYRRSKQQFDNNSQDPDVVYRHSGISGEDSPNGQVTHETFPMVPENPLEVSPVIGQKDPMFRDFEKASDLVEKSKKCVDRLSSPCTCTQSPVIYRCICQGLGCTFGRPDSQWNVVGHRSKFAQLHINILELKAVFLAIRSFQTHLMNKRVLVASDNVTVVSYLNKQGGTHSLEMCLMIWRLMALCNPRAILLRAQHIQGCLNVIAYSLSCRDKIIQTE